MSPELVDTLPRSVKKKLPTAVMKLKPTIRNRIFNYKEVVSNYYDGQEEDMTCDCHNSQYKDEHHGHVITGDLDIIRNRKLRDLFRKGPNFREKEPMFWNVAKKALLEDIKRFITKWSVSVNGNAN